MREGQFEVCITSGDGVHLKEQHLGTKTYVEATPGEKFVVVVRIYSTLIGNKIQWPATRLRIGLYVDGIDVGYWKRIDLSNLHLLPQDLSPVTTEFCGYKVDSDLHQFVFAEPTTNDNPPPQNHGSFGSLKICIFEAKPASGGGIFLNSTTISACPSNTDIGDSKFYQNSRIRQPN